MNSLLLLLSLLLSSIEVKSQFEVRSKNGKTTIHGYKPLPLPAGDTESERWIAFNPGDVLIVKNAEPGYRLEDETAYVVEVITFKTISQGDIMIASTPRCTSDHCSMEQIQINGDRALQHRLNKRVSDGVFQDPTKVGPGLPDGEAVKRSNIAHLEYRWIEKKGDTDINHIICAATIQADQLRRWTRDRIAKNAVGPIGGVPRLMTGLFHATAEYGFGTGAHKEFDNVLISDENDDHYKKSDVKYQVINIPTNTNDGHDNNYIMVISIIFIVLTGLCAIVCFIMGSGVSAAYCYSFAKRKNYDNKYSSVNNDTELV